MTVRNALAGPAGDDPQPMAEIAVGARHHSAHQNRNEAGQFVPGRREPPASPESAPERFTEMTTFPRNRLAG